jgi:tetratricopeptide (TPR) repeat protein
MTESSSDQQLADDLRRFLDGQPIRARRPRWREQVRRWVCRHAVGLTLTGSALLVISLILAVSTGMTLRAYREVSRRQAAAEQAHEEAARKHAAAERSQETVRRVVGNLFAGVVIDWLDNETALEPLQRHLLEQLLGSCQELASEDPTDTRAKWQVAQALIYIARIQARLSQHVAALQSYEEALANLTDLARQEGSPVGLLDRARCLNHQGNSFQVLGNRTRAEQAYREAIALLEPLVADLACRFELARALDARAVVLQGNREQSIESEKDHRRAIGYFTELARMKSPDPRYLIELARSRLNLAAALSRANRLREAEEQYAQAVEEFRRLHRTHPMARAYREGLAVCLANQSRFWARSGRLPQALESARHAVDLATRLANDFPNIASYRERQASHLLALGETLGPAGHAAEAETAVGQAIAILTRLVADLPAATAHRQRLAEAQLRLGTYRANQGRWADAEPPFRASVLLLLPLVQENPQHPGYRQDLARTMPRLRALQALGGRYKEAKACQTEIGTALERLARQHPKDVLWIDALTETQGTLGALFLCLGDLGQAEAHYQRQRELLTAEACLPDATRRLARFLTTCPALRCRDPRAALRLIEQPRQSSSGTNCADRVVMAATYNGLGRYQDAIERLGPAVHGVPAGDIDLCLQLAIAHNGLGQRAEAVRALRRAVPSITPGRSVELDQRILLAQVSELLGDPELTCQLALPAPVDRALPEGNQGRDP